MLQTDVLVVENEQEVFTAMIALKEGQGSFADDVIAALGARVGCSSTLTFDRKAPRLPDFKTHSCSSVATEIAEGRDSAGATPRYRKTRELGS
jgi:hypothetical protein